MSDHPPLNPLELPLGLAAEVDRICDRFGAEWAAGRRPKAEDYMAGVGETLRTSLLEELMQVELEARHNAGETPTPDEFLSRFPGHTAAIAAAFQALTVTNPDRLGDPEPVRVGKLLGNYRLDSELAHGGMGVVYKATQLNLNRIVAVKTIRAGQLATPEAVRRFQIEAEAAATLDHPGIVPVYEVGQHEGQHYFSMGFVEGQSLSHRLAHGPLSSRPAAELLRRVAEAIEYAHRRGVIHRDLKPANILLDRTGNPRVSDFGLAKKVEGDSGLTVSGQIMGSPRYMAPEQARGLTKDVGPAADVYALGAIFYEMLTGRPPFKGETPIETLRQVVEEEVVPPSRLIPRVPRDLETICLQCLNKEPSRRYGSASALAEDLERFLVGRPIKARRTPLWERGLKLARRHPVAATLLTLGMVALVGLGGGWLRYSSREARRKSELRIRITQSLFKVQELLTQHRWNDAEPILTSIHTELQGDRDLGDLSRSTGDLLDQTRRGKAEQQARRQDQGRLNRFRERQRDALYHETHFPGLDLPYDREMVSTSARAALAVFAAPGTPESWELGKLPASFSLREHEEVEEGCYELLLILAETEEPGRGLRLLDRAAKLRPPTRAFHLRRADCLARRRDESGARRERQTAEALPLASTLDHFLIGKELYKRGRWAEAIPHLNAALLSQPGHFWAHCLSAISSLRLQRPVPAWYELTACLRNEPDLAWLHELRGVASYQVATLARNAAESLQARGGTLRTEIQLQLHAAEVDFNKALELLDATPNKDLQYAVLVNRGLLWLERREWDKAIADLQAAIRLDDRRWQAFEVLAQVYQRQEKADRAIEQFTRAINLRPDWSPLYRARAAVHLGRKDADPAQRARALADLEQAIRLEPPGTPILALDYTRRAGLLHQEAREKEALASCEAALQIDPNSLDARRLSIDILRKLKRYDDIIRSCDALLARSKPSAELYELRGLAKEKLGHYQAAIEDQTLAIALRPGTAPLLSVRGALYLVTDAPRSARRDFQEAIRLDPANGDAYLGRGLAHAALGRHREAVADAAKALSTGERTTLRLHNAARIHAQAAIAAAAEVRKTGQDGASLAIHYQEQAIRLLGEWYRRLPPADRSSSLRDLLQDPAMATLRRRLRTLEPAGPAASAVR